MLGVERGVADAEGDRGSGRVGVSCTPQRRGQREPLGPLDGVRARPQSGVTVDTPVRFLRLAEARRVPAVVLDFFSGVVWCGVQQGSELGREGCWRTDYIYLTRGNPKVEQRSV